MSIFETQVKDVAERADSDPLELVSRFTTVTSEDTDDSDNATVEASPGEIVIVDEDGDNTLTDAATVTVELLEEAPQNGKVIVKHVEAGATSPTVNVEVAGDSSVDGIGGDPVTVSAGGSSTYLADGDTYYEL